MLRIEQHDGLCRVIAARTVAGRPLHSVSAYLVQDLLIDCGPPATARRLADWAVGNGVRRVAVTHHHEDHVGGGAELSRRLDVELLAPGGCVQQIRAPRRIPVYRRLVWGRPSPAPARPVGRFVELRGRALQVVPTAGHTPHHVAFFDPEDRTVYTGDLFVHERIRYLREVEDPWQQIESLRRIADLSPRRLACSHAGVIEDVSSALGRRIAWWTGLADRATELAERGWSVRRIRRELLGREGWMTWISGGRFSKGNLVRALLRRPAQRTARG